MVSWAEVLHKVCVIFEIVDSNAQVLVETDVHRQARWPRGKTSIIDTSEQEWNCRLASSQLEGSRFLGLRQTVPSGCRMGPLHHQIQCSKVPYRKFHTLF